MINKIEHLILCTLTNSLYPVLKLLLSLFGHFSIELYFLTELYECFIYSGYRYFVDYICLKYLQICGLPFYYFNIFNFTIIKFINPYL